MKSTLITHCTKNKLKCIKDLNIRPETVKFKEENLRTLVLEMIFIYMTPEAQATKMKINK